jgi:hypothetical protein
MATGCEEVSAHMMELLYGELPGEDRAAIEAHLADCPSCRAELAEFRATRVAARRALDEDAPPARAHQAILRAAAAAVAAKQPQPIEARAVPARRSLWERLRARWTLPTFATIGAVAVVVLASKVFLEPAKTVELGRQAIQPTPAEPPVAPAAEGTAQPEAKEESQAAKQRKREALAPDLQGSPATRSIAEHPAQRRRAAPADGFGALGGLAKGSGAGPAHAKSPAVDDVMAAENRPVAPPAPKMAKREFAPPPPPRGGPARDEETSLGDVARLRAGKGSVSGGAGAEPSPAHAATAKRTEKADSPGLPTELDRAPAASAPAPAAAPSAPVAEADEAGRAEAKDKADDSAQARSAVKPRAESPGAHADRLFTEGRWAEAARAYRDLLRRDPHNAEAARWRQRLAASEAAAAPEAPAAASPPAR